MFPPPPISTLFPYTTLFRSVRTGGLAPAVNGSRTTPHGRSRLTPDVSGRLCPVLVVHRGELPDRKSTRLNSSHLVTSYAVFCLKKKINFTSNHYLKCL